ncbi:MAG: nitroreductase family protein [Saprospiraceae bacterium]|nr:nitroreductase family protein [Saprospiraceae bacterium]
MQSKLIKVANTIQPVLELIKQRWSARSFNKQAISQEEFHTIMEAATWAASANNEQPWMYYYAHNNTESFSKLWECLVDGNKPWTKSASVLMIACVRKTFEKTGKNNGSAEHDLGMASSQLLLQATSMNIYGHIMGGFDRIKAKELLNLDDNIVPVNMIALGYLAEADQLEEPYRTRELTGRNRKKVEEFSFEL